MCCPVKAQPPRGSSSPGLPFRGAVSLVIPDWKGFRNVPPAPRHICSSALPEILDLDENKESEAPREALPLRIVRVQN